MWSKYTHNPPREVIYKGWKIVREPGATQWFSIRERSKGQRVVYLLP